MEIDLQEYNYLLFKPFNKIYVIEKINGNKINPFKFLSLYQYDVILNDLEDYTDDNKPYRILEKNDKGFTLYLKEILPNIFFSSKYNIDRADLYFQIEILLKIEKRENDFAFIGESEQITLINTYDNRPYLFNKIFDDYFEIMEDPINERDFLKLDKSTDIYHNITGVREMFSDVKNNKMINKTGLLKILYDVNYNILDKLMLYRSLFGIEFYTSNRFFADKLEYSDLLDSKFLENIDYDPFIPSKDYKKFKIDNGDFIDFNDTDYFQLLKTEKEIKSFIVKNNFN